MVVLNEGFPDAGFRQPTLMVALEEESAGILVDLWADYIYAWDFGLAYLQVAPDAALRP